MALMRGSANAMSEVISLRLSKENPREALAYEILKGWHEKGHSIRHTITEALLKLGEPCPDLVPSEKLNEVNETLVQIRQLLEHTQHSDASSQKGQETGPY